MATFTKRLLSESVNGKGVKVAATATPGTLIHTAASGTSDLDEVWIWAVNSSSSAVKLTIQWGEVTDPDGHIEGIVPPESGLFTIIPGLLLQNSLEIRAFAGTTNVVIVHGFVNRIS